MYLKQFRNALFILFESNRKLLLLTDTPGTQKMFATDKYRLILGVFESICISLDEYNKET